MKSLSRVVAIATALLGTFAPCLAQTVADPALVVTPYATGLLQPVGLVFIGPGDALVIEKASGRVRRVVNGVVQAAAVLDLPVNSSSERGLLGIALHPQFPAVPSVYLLWTESATGADSVDVSATPALGTRLDRWTWNGSQLVFNQKLLSLRARQTDNVPVPGHEGTQNAAERGNHNGGQLRFGPDGKLYVFVGDLGRRGWMQNLGSGPFVAEPLVDDTLGGPAPDAAHLSGVVLRLNADGSVPADNPFFALGSSLGGDVGAQLTRVYSYGHRNGFGMDFDRASGLLWLTENADDAFSELNAVTPGMNGGWIQVAGPLSRLAEFKRIETLSFGSSLQQTRYPPTRIAYTAALARSRMVMLPGATYRDPQLSWRYEVAPAGAAFVHGNGLGTPYTGTLWLGTATDSNSRLYCLRLTADRRSVDTSADPRLADGVVDNLAKYDATEAESLVIGQGFGATPDIREGPDGALYVVSLSRGTVYRIALR
ncbi:PQQ-dependent sugar dehydrogenase [Aquincola tertiaricarbonis]|uniref:PQQ-dependent sugar dehydrogenase n=1 Tax=Aquincola tertiaricarbonis TaxID=391953 RepID=UPI00061504B9|nr:PQQ-dependent sugar dehydrogenase [Aquincola tertiaricarbonis]